MFFVYILVTTTNSNKYYVGITGDLDRRLNQHNHSPTCSHTIKYAPWNLKTYVAFDDKKSAEQFEIYLKSHSGKAFLKKRLININN